MRVSRVGYVVPVALAACELRYLLGCLARLGAVLHGGGLDVHGGTVWCTIVLAAVGAGLLREVSRGLLRRLPRPRRSLGFAVTWALSAVALLAIIRAASLLVGGVPFGQVGTHGAFAAGGWSSALPAAACAGLLLAQALAGIRWVARRLVSVSRGWLARGYRRVRLLPAAVAVHMAPGPLLAGWSGRGPPLDPAFATV